MAEKTSVDGNRVVIDDAEYTVKPAGTDRYAVFDYFGAALGYFMVRGKMIQPDDYRIAGAHPIVQIGRLWRAGNAGELEAKANPPSKMVCEVLTLAPIESALLDGARAHVRWLKTQPGLKSAFYAHDPTTGKAMAVRVWATQGHLERCRAATPPEDAKELPSTSTDVLALLDDL